MSFRLGSIDSLSLLFGEKNENLVSLLIHILKESLFARSQFSKDVSSVWVMENSVFLF